MNPHARKTNSKEKIDCEGKKEMEEMTNKIKK